MMRKAMRVVTALALLSTTVLATGCGKQPGGENPNGENPSGEDPNLVAMNCVKEAKGSIMVPKEGQVCAQASNYDCFEHKAKFGAWLISVSSSYAATESPEQAIEHFKANAGLNTPGEVVKLGPGDYLVEIIYEAKTSGYQRFLANASVTCEGISNPSPELLGLLKKSCESFKPTM